MTPSTSTNEPTDSVDEGTATGAPTMALARLLSGVFAAARVAVGGFGRLLTVATTVSGFVGWCLRAPVAGVGLALRAARRWLSTVLRQAAAVVASHPRSAALVLVGIVAGRGLVLGEPGGVVASYPVVPAVDTIADSGSLWVALLLGVTYLVRVRRPAWIDTQRSRIGRLGRAIGSICHRLGRAIGSICHRMGGPVWSLAQLAVAALGRMFDRVAHLLDRIVGAMWSNCRRLGGRVWSSLTRASQLALRAARRIASTVRALLDRLANPARRLAQLAVAALGRMFERIGQSLERIISAIDSTGHRLVKHLATWLTRASQLVHRVSHLVAAPVRALLDRLANPARRHVQLALATLRRVFERTVRHVAYLGDRVTLSTGVAVARARMTAVAAPANAVQLGRPPADRHDVTSGFTATVFQNEYLPEGAREAHAVITVTSAVGRDESSPDSAVVLLLDCSGSMGRPWSKLRAARQATAAAIDALAEGTWFAIVRGNDRAEVAYPPSGDLARSTAETRAAAKRALRLLWPEGGTAMGRWLLAAGELFAGSPAAVNRAILLTDGRNESETARALDDALRACAGRFQCDCRGVGADWSVDELRTIANGLLGTIDVVPDPDLLTADFEAMAAAAMARGVGEVRLDVQAPSGGSLLHLSQATPAWIPLPLARSDDGVYRCSTGAWGAETRDFHLSVGLPAAEVGDEMLAAKVRLVVDGRVATQLQVKAIWCDDERQPTAMHPAVAHYETQAQIVASIGRGLGAQGAGDVATATRELGRAAQLADASDQAATMRLLEAVVDVEDAATGVVRIKSTIDLLEAMTLDARSTRTSAWRGDRDPEDP